MYRLYTDDTQLYVSYSTALTHRMKSVLRQMVSQDKIHEIVVHADITCKLMPAFLHI